MRLGDGVAVRRATDTDIELIRNLELSFDNKLEITKFTGLSYKEYLTWHVFNSLETTHLLYIKDELTAILGLGESNNLFFLTTDNLSRNRKLAVKYFRDVLEYLMRVELATECKVFIDVNYTSSVNWAVRNGFKYMTSIELDKETKFGVYTYKIQKDKLSL